MSKKLIEVALPLDAINRAAAREKSIRHGHPCTLHLWWSRKPLAACRAVLFAQLVDDPSAHPERFPTEEAQAAERRRLFLLIEGLIRWEQSTNRELMRQARDEIMRYVGGVPPPVLDAFCGGGSIPLEALRLGLPATGHDLNPVAALVTLATIDLPARFAGLPPVHTAGDIRALPSAWTGAAGLAADLRHYGAWMREEAERRIGHLYPPVQTARTGSDPRPVQAWIWARTVPCPNPSCGLIAPLASSWELCTQSHRRAWVEPVVDAAARTVRYTIRTGEGMASPGTINRRGALCLACGSPIPFEHIRSMADAGRIGQQIIAMVADAATGPRYLPPDPAHATIAEAAEPGDVPETELPEQALGFRVQKYGLRRHRDLFTARQLVLLSTYSDLVGEVHRCVERDATVAGLAGDAPGVADGGRGARAYADAVATYLAFAIDKLVDKHTALIPWDTGNGRMGHTFARAILPMIWSHTEANPFATPTGDLTAALAYLCEALEALPATPGGGAMQADAMQPIGGAAPYVISTDPPYYDNIGYADLSDIFYVWLRRTLRGIYPQLFSTMLVPKAHELIAAPGRHGGDAGKAGRFFESGLHLAFANMRSAQHPDYPLTIYYAFKQTEQEPDQLALDRALVASTGWEKMLEGLLGADFVITGTWPMRTEGSGRVRAHDSNALASSIVLVCRPRPADAPVGTRREFLQGLAAELPDALRRLQQGNIAPVDLAQAAIGPGMAVFSRYRAVLEVDGSPMRVRTALGLINRALDAVLTEQDGDYDAETRWALAWYEGFGAGTGSYDEAELLSKAKNTSTKRLVELGILQTAGGKARLVRRQEMPAPGDPALGRCRTVWQATQCLAHTLAEEGERAVAQLLAQLASVGERPKELAYRLYLLCERRGWAEDAVAYNALVIAWPEIAAEEGRLVRDAVATRQGELAYGDG